MTLTASYDTTLSRVVITGSGLADGHVRVERSVGGVLWEPVRGALALEVVGGELVAYDYEFAAGAENFYRVVAAVDEVLDRPSEDQTWGDEWEVPPGIRSLAVQCWGAGGAVVGSGAPTGGAGGGAFAASEIQVGPGEVLRLRVGRSGWDDTGAGQASAVIQDRAAVVQAAGGAGVLASPTGGAGGVAVFPASVGDTTWPGGDGGDADTGGGGGGGSATSSAAGDAGAAASGATGGVGGAGEGPGGAGGDDGDPGASGGQPGGGAGGHGAGAVGTVLGGHGRITLSSWPAGVPEQASITPVLDGIWLKNIRYANLNRRIEVVEFTDPSTSSRDGVFTVVGRSTPVTVGDQRSAGAFTIEVLTRTAEDATALQVALTVGGTWLLHTPPGCPVPGGWVTIGDTERTRGTRSARSPWRTTSLPCTVTARPGPDVVPSTLTWGTVLRTFGSWAELLAVHPDWASLLATVGSPDDPVVL